MKNANEWAKELAQVDGKKEPSAATEKIVVDILYSLYDEMLSLIDDVSGYEDNALEELTDLVQARITDLETDLE